MPPGHRHHLLHWAVERERERERERTVAGGDGGATPGRWAVAASPLSGFGGGESAPSGRCRHLHRAAKRKREREREGGEREREKHGRLVGG